MNVDRAAVASLQDALRRERARGVALDDEQVAAVAVAHLSGLGWRPPGPRAEALCGPVSPWTPGLAVGANLAPLAPGSPVPAPRGVDSGGTARAGTRDGVGGVLDDR